jgi:uncharacterized protein YcbX
MVLDQDTTPVDHDPMRLASIWRYPVKSMAGEVLESVELDARGLVGDRWYAVEDDEGHFASGKNTTRFRRRDPVFAYAARTTPAGVLVAGPEGEWAVGDTALDDTLGRRMGLPVAVRPEGSVPHQDQGAVSLVGTATLAWCAERWDIDADPRRLRVNLLVETTEPFVEETWIGQSLEIGTALLTVAERIPRCRMIDLGEGGAAAHGRWLKPLGRERDTCIAMYADVARPGVVRVGDAVQVG